MMMVQHENPIHLQYMYGFRVHLCVSFMNGNCQNFSSCFDCHPPLMTRRRKPQLLRGRFNYIPSKCRYIADNNRCPQGDHCRFAHCTEEIVYHPSKYKTQLCTFELSNEGICSGYGQHCAKAHGEIDQRKPIFEDDVANVTTSSGLPTPQIHDFVCQSSERENERAYFMYQYKVQRCVGFPWDCRCNDLHYHREEERRRGPVITYLPISCPNGLGCPLGDACDKCHTLLELMYHPQVYKTGLCSHFDEHDLTRWRCVWLRRCAHAHGVGDLRNKEDAANQWNEHRRLHGGQQQQQQIHHHHHHVHHQTNNDTTITTTNNNNNDVDNDDDNDDDENTNTNHSPPIVKNVPADVINLLLGGDRKSRTRSVGASDDPILAMPDIDETETDMSVAHNTQQQQHQKSQQQEQQRRQHIGMMDLERRSRSQPLLVESLGQLYRRKNGHSVIRKRVGIDGIAVFRVTSEFEPLLWENMSRTDAFKRIRVDEQPLLAKVLHGASDARIEEIDRLIDLNCESFVKYIHHIKEDNLFLITMQPFSNKTESLWSLIKNKKSTTLNTCDIARQLLLTMSKLHEIGVIHGGISPMSVCITDTTTSSIIIDDIQRMELTSVANNVLSSNDERRDWIGNDDLWSIGAAIYFVATCGHHPNDDEQELHPILADLIIRLLDTKKHNWSCVKALRHPYFWLNHNNDEYAYFLYKALCALDGRISPNLGLNSVHYDRPFVWQTYLSEVFAPSRAPPRAQQWWSVDHVGLRYLAAFVVDFAPNHNNSNNNNALMMDLLRQIPAIIIALVYDCLVCENFWLTVDVNLNEFFDGYPIIDTKEKTKPKPIRISDLRSFLECKLVGTSSTHIMYKPVTLKCCGISICTTCVREYFSKSLQCRECHHEWTNESVAYLEEKGPIAQALSNLCDILRPQKNTQGGTPSLMSSPENSWQSVIDRAMSSVL